MSAASPERIRSVDELVEHYHRVNWEQTLCVGIEWERSGIHRENTSPVQYEGDKGYNAILQKLVAEVGWEILEKDDDHIYEIKRGDTRVTLEGDGRLELAGSPQENLHDLARELRLHNNEVIEMGNYFGIGWLSLGQQPLHTNAEISLINKKRYSILQGIGKKGFAETMAKRLNGVTANLSYLNEQNAIQKAQTAFRVLPIVGAMFACSPFDGGKRGALLDERRNCIQHHSPNRTGIPPGILSETFSIGDWFEYYIALPVILVPDEKDVVRLPNKEFTFREWMEDGYEGTFPTFADFDRHVKTTWSDLRLRPSYLEYRVADSVPFRHIMGIPALMKGLMFDSGSWKQVKELTKDWTYEEIIDIDKRAWKTGLQTEVRGKKLLTYAQEIITIANEKLHTFNRKDASNEDESTYLSAIKKQIFIKEKSPAEELVALYESEWNGNLSRILEWCDRAEVA